MVAIKRDHVLYRHGASPQWTTRPSEATWFKSEEEARHEAFAAGLDTDEFEVVEEREVWTLGS
jgi:hypothetical protein